MYLITILGGKSATRISISHEDFCVYYLSPLVKISIHEKKLKKDRLE